MNRKTRRTVGMLATLLMIALPGGVSYGAQLGVNATDLVLVFMEQLPSPRFSPSGPAAR